MNIKPDQTFHIEVSPAAYVELLVEMRLAGHPAEIDADGAIHHLCQVRIKRKRPPRLDDAGPGMFTDPENEEFS